MYVNKKFAQGVIRQRERLTREAGSRAAYHITLSTAGSGICHRVGDSLAILPNNDHQIVAQILDLIHREGSETFYHAKTDQVEQLAPFFTHSVDLARLNLGLARALIGHSPSSPLHDLLTQGREGELRCYLKEHHLLDLLSHSEAASCPLEQWACHLSPLLPRFYSIASSPLVGKEELDLLVSTFSYSSVQGERLGGVGSDFLTRHAQIDTTPIPFYLHPSRCFTLPEDPQHPIVMIGSGTGIAPYRAFLQQRGSALSQESNWLFFGERRRTNDFFYEPFLSTLVEEHKLRLTTAFSQDQTSKVYVQHRLEEHAQELLDWIDRGAILYICGDAKGMAKGVLSTLGALFEQERGLSAEQARVRLLQLRQHRQLLLDVY